MGLLRCPLPCKTCHKHKQSQGDHSQSEHSINGLLDSESSSNSTSLSSQPSLPSVPSLTSQHSLTFRTVHHQCLATLKNSSNSSVSSLTVHGKFLYGGYSDSKIQAWNRDHFVDSSNHESFMVATSQGAVKSLVAVNNLLFSAHQDHKIRVWKINNDTNKNKDCCYDLIATLPTIRDRFLRCFSEKNYVQVRRHKKCTWVHHVDTVSALAVSNDKSLLYSASWDRSFKIWRTSDFKCMESVNAHDDAINSIVLSNDGFLYTGSADKKIKVWKQHNGDKKHTLVDTLERHKSSVNALALSSDGCVLYSGACDRSILVWEKNSGGGGGHMALVGALRGHSKAILCLAVVNDVVWSGSADNTVRVWRGGAEKKYSCLAVLEGPHRRPVKCLTVAVDSNSDRNGGVFDFSGTSYLVYSGSLDGDIRIWQVWIPRIC